MDHTAGAPGFRIGDRVEVVTRFTGNWVGGFEIATTGAAGCRVRRLSDDALLPTVFGYDQLRATSRNLDRTAAPTNVPALPTHESRSDAVVLRLPAELDIGTVELIRDAVLDAVDVAHREVVLDFDGVEFLDSYGIRLLVAVRRRAWERDMPVRLRGGKPLIRALLDLVGVDPLYQQEPCDTTPRVPIE